MSLENEIQQQYQQRLNTGDLYNSEYSGRAEAERNRKMTGLVRKYSANPGSVLEIGAGQGNNVPALQACGFSEIVLNELLPDRVAMARGQYPHLQIFAGNALDIQFNRQFDCVFQSTVFTSILSDKDRIELASKMWELLKPGGFILWYDFIYNNPSNPFVRKVGVREIRRLFPFAHSSEMMKVTLAPPIGRRVGKLYPLFNVPLLRSHILALIQKEH